MDGAEQLRMDHVRSLDLEELLEEDDRSSTSSGGEDDGGAGSSGGFTFDPSVTSMHSYLGVGVDVDYVSGGRAFIEQGEVLEIPMFYLSGIVLFPEQTLPLRVIQPRFKAAVARAMRQENVAHIIGVLHVESPTSKVAGVGTTAEIRQFKEFPDGAINVLTKGRQRFRLIRRWQCNDGSPMARVEIINEDPPLFIPRVAFSQLASLPPPISGKGVKRRNRSLLKTQKKRFEKKSGGSSFRVRTEFRRDRGIQEEGNEEEELDSSGNEGEGEGEEGEGVGDGDGEGEGEGDDAEMSESEQSQDCKDSPMFPIVRNEAPESRTVLSLPLPRAGEGENVRRWWRRRDGEEEGEAIWNQEELLGLIDTNSIETNNVEMNDEGGEEGQGEAGRGEVGRGEVGRGEVGRGEGGRGEAGRGEAGKWNEMENHVANGSSKDKFRRKIRHVWGGAGNSWAVDEMNWSRRASMAYWPHWVYRMYDAFDLARRVADMFQQLTAAPLVSDLIHYPDRLAWYIASNMPLQDTVRQELLEVNTTVYRLRKEMELLETMDKLLCKQCKEVIALRSDMTLMSSEGLITAFVNAHGFVHETLTLRRAHGLVLEGRPETENSWFPGYAWTIAMCSYCGSHAGWRFTAVKRNLQPSSFWGIRRTQLVTAGATLKGD